MKKIVSLYKFVWKQVTIPFYWIKKNPQFSVAIATAFALIWQNCTLRDQIDLYEQELRSEQKPIIYRGVGEYEESRFQNNRLIVTEHILNMGNLPAYNVTGRSAIRRSSEFPAQHFNDLINRDSLNRNIYLPGIPSIDTLSIEFSTNVGEITIKQFAYELFENNEHIYVHLCTLYQDVADRCYILKQTLELHGRPDSTMFWSLQYAVDEQL